MTVPVNPKIYHITHVRNLTAIAESGKILSDAKRIETGINCELVGMSTIKQRRLREIKVSCHAGTTVGEYTPFYFCPRSIMLYILNRGNHQDIDYHEGQEPIVHLEADLYKTIRWAEANGVAWAFTDGNAGSYLASFYNDISDLDKVNWTAVLQRDFRDSFIKEGKQAEFLMYGGFPWNLIDKIGVISEQRAVNVRESLRDAAYVPLVSVERLWYY